MNYDNEDTEELPERIEAEDLPALLDTTEHVLAYALPPQEA